MGLLESGFFERSEENRFSAADSGDGDRRFRAIRDHDSMPGGLMEQLSGSNADK